MKSSEDSALPIYSIDLTRSDDRARHDQIVALVDRLLDLHRRLAAATMSHDRAIIQRQIEAMDHQIDRLVYELYDLTDDEIRIVEEATKHS